MKGEKMFDKMSAHCEALNVAAATRSTSMALRIAVRWGQGCLNLRTCDVDKSQPDMDCGSHIITGGTGKYAGISGKEPFKCIKLPALAGSGGFTAMDIPHIHDLGDRYRTLVLTSEQARVPIAV